MKRILIGGAGGTPANNFISSLKKSNEEFHFIGITSGKYDIHKAMTNEKYLVPLARDENYIQVLKLIIAKTKPDFMHVQNDAEVKVVSDNRDEIGVKTFLPSKETVDICVNKWRSYQRWKEAGLKIPETMVIRNESDLKDAFKRFGKVWIRFDEGAFGRGSLPTDNYEFARIWIDFYQGWGQFCAAECLEQQTITWMSLWKEGNLIVAQGRKRLYWEFANRTISGVTGITGTGVTVSDQLLDDLAQKAIFAVDPKPNGIFSIDFTYDKYGIPNPTEINIGRFFTTHNFFTEAGLNMPEIYIKLAFNESLPYIPRKINPLPSGLAWIRGMDTEPVLVSTKDINRYEETLKAFTDKIKTI